MHVADDAGREITIPNRSARILSLAPSATEILYAIGAGDRVVGVDRFSDYPADARKLPQVGDFADPSQETIASLAPDLVIGVSLHVKSTVPLLEARGIPVVILDPSTVEGVIADITLVGKATGNDRQAEAVTRDLRLHMAETKRRIAGAPIVSAFLELDAQLYTVGPNTFLDDLIHYAGGRSVAESGSESWPQMSQEALLHSDPDCVLLADQAGGVTIQSVHDRPGWSAMTAVRGNRIVVVPQDVISRPGPRLAQGMDALARALHPDRFVTGQKP